MKKLLTVIFSAFLFSSCAILPFGTDVWINRKLDDIPVGASKEAAVKKFGNPIYRIRFSAANVEIWGYDLGHYWYNESVTLFFKEDRFIGVPRTPYDLIVFMHRLRLMDPSVSFLPGHMAET